jgi:hypothetical protein
MLVDIGEHSGARILLWKVQYLHHQDGYALNLLRLRWLWGRISAGLGDFGRAERDLQTARAGFEVAGKPYHKALVSLDLAEVYVRQGRRSEAQSLAVEMLNTFKSLGIAREVIAVLLLTRERCEVSFVAPKELCRYFREVAVLLTELDRARPQHRRLGN